MYIAHLRLLEFIKRCRYADYGCLTLGYPRAIRRGPQHTRRYDRGQILILDVTDVIAAGSDIPYFFFTFIKAYD